jgi:hypothetical protein
VSNGGPIGERAFLYENGMIVDLNRLIQQDSPLYLLIAQGINDSGEIVGAALDASGEQVGFLAIPAYGRASVADPSKANRDDNSRNIIFPSGFRPRLTGFSRMLLEATEAK